VDNQESTAEPDEETAATVAANKAAAEAMAKATADAEYRSELEQAGELRVKVTWTKDKKGLTAEAALLELAKLRAEAALTGALRVGPCSDTRRLMVEIELALLNAEIKNGDGLSARTELAIRHAVKKRERKRLRAMAALSRVPAGEG